MKSSAIWDVLLVSPMKVNQCFKGTCHLHPQIWSLLCVLPASCWFHAWLFSPENGGNIFIQNISWFLADYAAFIPDRTLCNCHLKSYFTFFFLVNCWYAHLYATMKHMVKQTETSSFLKKNSEKLPGHFWCKLIDSTVCGKLEDT